MRRCHHWPDWTLVAGYAFVPLPFRLYDWMEYVPRPGWSHTASISRICDWRNPLPGDSGHVGEWIGYNGHLGSIQPSVGCGDFSGFGARAMANPAAGMVAAVTIPFINPWAEASRWSTLYPMLTACTAVALAFGAAFIRWGRPAFGGIAGLAAGLALGIDFRGIALIVAVSAMGLVALRRSHPKKAIALTLALMMVGPYFNHRFSVSHQKQTATAVQTQRDLEVRALESGNRTSFERAEMNPQTKPIQHRPPSLDRAPGLLFETIWIA